MQSVLPSLRDPAAIGFATKVICTSCTICFPTFLACGSENRDNPRPAEMPIPCDPADSPEVSADGEIFIQISSYRDPQLAATLRDCLRQARHPERLHCCVAHQYDDSEDLSEFSGTHPSGARFTFIKTPYHESQGACWARHQIQQRYAGEKFTLQLDSHHRFAEGWDTQCIAMLTALQAAGCTKPLLTAYLPSFDPDADPQSRIDQPWQMNFDRFTPEGVVFFLPGCIPKWRELSTPIPARFFSAHFTFTLGSHCVEVPHDPEFYFHGEEISLAVRSFTHGYDLFHPHLVIAWHEYTRKGRTKHWDDHKTWHLRNTASLARNRRLLGVDGEQSDGDFGRYGLGSVRTLDDYQHYAGIRFHDRAVQTSTLAHHPPSDPLTTNEDADWAYPLSRHLSLPADSVPENDYDFWCVAFHNAEGKELHREDADRAEIARLKNSREKIYRIRRAFNAVEKPSQCVIWPHSLSKGWGPQIRLPL